MQPRSSLLLLALMVTVFVVRPPMADPLGLGEMQGASMADSRGERSGGHWLVGHRRTTCALGQRYSTFYRKCVRW